MICWPYLKRIHIRILCVLLITLIFVYNISFLSNISQFLHKSQKHLIYCYFENKHNHSLLELDPNEVTKNSIFFIETSCNHKKGIHLNLRQGCAIESAANLNPNLKIFVLFVSASFVNNKSDIINTLNTYKNINLRYINLTRYSYQTPVHDFVMSNKIFMSNWPISHTSDLLRFLTLWKFGGTYLDLDVVLMKSIEGITNFVSAESSSSIASLVLNFDVDDIGKTIANIAINDFVDNYRGNDWGYNGPGVITRALQKMCNTYLINDMDRLMCKGFMVFKPEAFCPISWEDWRLYFDENNSNKVMAKLEDRMGIHVWNLHSKNSNIIVGSKQPYGLVAKKYCSSIFSLAKYVF
ncbi:Nucleotide-diphospho-sugar transferases,Glycosyltransferase, DXD sugar-binding [Cinara cedri]|uniref:Nucleotide-diphospho-sugar transferases,Glycosyltransferase, DXD sugar-binding n=1 Tax=Cinara cedri TaxID=506608 RepID=A0A5E4NF22_9HEMI|nr:Nucleotide-diphospho-sugar transferases,Glycosyltransferase, DXD sugar-binding [Cinara cedri]